MRSGVDLVFVQPQLLLGLVVLGILLTIGADRGAQLVYQYGSAVNWSTAQQQN